MENYTNGHDNNWDHNEHYGHDQDNTGFEDQVDVDFNDEDMFGDGGEQGQDIGSEHNDNNPDHGESEEKATTNTDDNKPAEPTFSWNDMVDFAKFTEAYDSMTDEERTVLHSTLEGTRKSATALVTAKKLLEQGAKSDGGSMSVIRELMSRTGSGTLGLRDIIDLSALVGGLSLDDQREATNIANAALEGDPINWRNNLPTETLTEKLIEKAQAGSKGGVLESVDAVTAIWPGKRKAGNK